MSEAVQAPEDKGNRLPANWAVATLGEVYVVVGGGTPSTESSEYWGDGTPWVTSADINGVRDIQPRKWVTPKGVENSTTNIVPVRSLLVVTRVGLGKIAITNAPVCFSQDVQGLIQSPSLVLPEFALHLLSYELQILKFQGRGTTISGITKKQLTDLAFPLAPIAEQQRIVAKLEELFSELDKSEESLRTAQQQLKVYRQALLDKAMRSLGAADYDLLPLQKLIGNLSQGWSPKCDLNREAMDGEWAIIKTTVVQPMCHVPQECKPFPAHLEPRPDLEIRDGDFLMTRKGPRNRTGVVCLVRKARPKSMLCDTVYRFRCNADLVTPEYLELLLNSPSVVSELDRRKSGISDSGISLNHSKIKTIPLQIPRSLYSQKKVVDLLGEKLSVIDQLETTITTALQQAATLRQAILKKAFSGQLVPQHPDDEPASVLLERIRAERAAQPAKARQRRSTTRVPAASLGAATKEKA